jgi:hypothetical protein
VIVLERDSDQTAPVHGNFAVVEPVVGTAKILEVSVTAPGEADFVVPPAVAVAAVSVVTALIAASIEPAASAAIAAITTAARPAPFDVESVAFTPALRVLDANHGRASIAGRIAQQGLSAAAVHAAEMEFERVLWKRRVAFHAAPCCGTSAQRAHPGLIALNLDFRNAVHFDL